MQDEQLPMGGIHGAGGSSDISSPDAMRTQQPSASMSLAPEVGGQSSNVDQKGKLGDTVKQMAGQMREEAMSVVDERRHAFAGRLDEMGEAVRRSGAELRQQQPWLADLIDRGAGQLGRLAGQMRDNDVRASIDQVKSFARRQPELFAGAALLAGFAGGRLLQLAFADRGSGKGSMEAYSG